MTAEPATLPIVRLKIERRSSHPWIFQKMVEKPAAQIPAGSVVDILDRDGQWVGRGFYNGHSRITLRVLTADPNEPIDAAFFARKIGARRRAPPRRAEARRGDGRLSARPLRGRRPERPGRGPLRADARDRVLRRRHVPAARGDPVGAARRTSPDSRFYWFAEEHVGKQESFDCRPPEPPPPVTITEHGVRFRVAPGSKHKTGFFARPARQPQDARRVLRRQAGARPVLQHRRLRGLRQGARRGGRGDRRRPRRAGDRAGEAERQAEPGARCTFAQADLFAVAARRAAQRRAVRRGGARPGQADPRPRGGRSGAEEVPAT